MNLVIQLAHFDVPSEEGLVEIRSKGAELEADVRSFQYESL